MSDELRAVAPHTSDDMLRVLGRFLAGKPGPDQRLAVSDMLRAMAAAAAAMGDDLRADQWRRLADHVAAPVTVERFADDLPPSAAAH